MAFSVRRGLAWMMFSQGGLFVIQFGGSVIVARLLTPYEMGIYAVAYAIVGILSTMRALGLSNFLVREPELTPDTVTTSFTINAILATVTAAAVAALSSAGGAWLRDVGVQRVLLLLSVSPLLSIFELVPVARLERIGSFRTVGLINLAKMAVSTAVTIALAYWGFSYMSIAWGTLASAVLGVILANIAGRQFVSVGLGLRDWRRVTRFGVRILMIGAIANVAQRLSDLLLGRLVGLNALGLYSRAAGLNVLLGDNIHSVIARIVYVDFAERHRRNLPLREAYLKIIAMITGLLWPAFAGLGILAGPVVLTIYGPAWTAAAPVLSVLAAGGVLGTSVTMAYEIYLVSGETDRLFRLEIIRNAIGLTLFTVGCTGGLIWAAVGRMGDVLVAVLIYQGEIRRMTGTFAADYMPIFGQSAALTVAACAPVTLLMMLNHWSEHTSLPAIFAAIGVGVAAWACGLWLLRHPLYLEAEIAGRHFFLRYVRGV